VSDVAASIISSFALTKNPKKHKMLGFGGDCFLGRKLNGRIREGGFHQSKLICVLEQMVSGVNLFFRKVHLICSSSSINGYTFQSQKKP